MRLIASIACDRAALMVERANVAHQAGADLVELRLDSLAHSEIAALWAADNRPTCPWIATLRSRAEGGLCDRSAEQRREVLLAAAKAGAAFLDVEHRDCALPFWGRGVLGQAGLIVSHHALGGMPDNPAALLRQLRDIRGNLPGAAKLAWACGDVTENLAALDLMRGDPDGRIVIAMGERGLMSRVLARKCRAFGTFCSANDGLPTALGQVSIKAMIHDFAWPGQTAGTQVFGVIGCPVAHSLSPAIFNAQFRRAGLNGVYLPLLVETEHELREFVQGCRARPWLNTRGFSVTVPHKHAALALAGELADPVTRRIGAANTLDFMEEGIAAYNTDYAGVLGALAEGLAIAEEELAGMPVAVLGAGGVARAVVAGLTERGARVTIYNRSAERARELAGAFKCRTADWSVRHEHEASLLINCTTLGMHPAIEETPMPSSGLRSNVAVMDTVYNPRETMFLRQARDAGCRTVDGVAMFVQQAAAQYHLWTSRAADTALFERIVSDSLRQ